MTNDFMEECQKYIIDSNEAIEFKFVRSTEDLESNKCSFKPDMSHQVFGDTETIFGYEDLKIKIYYTPGWLRTYIGVDYKQKISVKADMKVEADDIIEALRKFLQYEFIENVDTFVNYLKEEPTFRPFGNHIHSVTLTTNDDQKTYEVYHVSGRKIDRKFLDYYNYLQPFIIWYIDCASYIDTDDERWQYFLMYEKYKNPDLETAYAVVGFATVYEYYAYPNNTRARISQALVLPPFRKQGLAAHLLHSIYRFYIPDTNVVDVTVESPTGEFQQLRDFVDICLCRSLECFSPENLKNGYNEEMANELRRRFKIHKKQARRIYEILLLEVTGTTNTEEYNKFRLQVKRRLNAQFQKVGKMISRTKSADPDMQMAKSLASSKETRLQILDKQYKDLEEQYLHVMNRYLKYPLKF